MPDIIGKKINELDQLPAGINPLLVGGDPDTGKAYSMEMQDLKERLDSLVIDGEVIPISVDLNTVVNAGNYILNQTSFSNGSYQNAHYIPGVMLTSDVVLSVEVFSTGDVIQRLRWPFEGGESVRRLVLNNASWAHGKTWTKWEHWGGVYWIDGTQSAFTGMDILNTQGNYIVNFGVVSSAQLAAKNLPNPNIGKTSNVYRGAIYVQVRGRNNYEGGYPDHSYLSQTVEYVRPIFQDNATHSMDRSYRFSRRYNLDLANGVERPENGWSDWILEVNTLASTSFNGFTPDDKRLVAGTATIPALAFTPGVQKQTTPVPNSFNTDGLNLFFTDKNGATYKLTMAAI